MVPSQRLQNARQAHAPQPSLSSPRASTTLPWHKYRWHCLQGEDRGQLRRTRARAAEPRRDYAILHTAAGSGYARSLVNHLLALRVDVTALLPMRGITRYAVASTHSSVLRGCWGQQTRKAA